MSTGKGKAGSSLARSVLWLLLALVGIALWLVSLQGPDVARAWRALLINFLFFTSLAGGMVTWPAVARSCNGRWLAGIERLPASGIAFALPSVVALVVLWLGSSQWSPWYQARYHQGLWLDNTVVFSRDLAFLVLFWVVAGTYLLQRRHGEARVWGPILVLVYTLSFSVLGFDLVMSLDPLWKTNLAGGYFFISGLYIAISCWGVLAARDPASSPDQRQDIGKLMIAFSMMTIYLMYAHLNLMYYENLPHEIRFLIPRMHIPGWTAVSYVIVLFAYFGPLVLLLGIDPKRNRWWLGIISVLLLCGMWIERWWLVSPTFESSVQLGLSELSLAAACLGLLGLGIEQFLRRVPESYFKEEKES